MNRDQASLRVGLSNIIHYNLFKAPKDKIFYQLLRNLKILVECRKYQALIHQPKPFKYGGGVKNHSLSARNWLLKTERYGLEHIPY